MAYGIYDMNTESKPLLDYVHSLEKEFAAGNTTEHTLRSALKTLLESLKPGITATNEPQHITAVGAPDFRIIKNKLAIGYVECKDIGKNMDEALETDQLKRYLHSFHNLLLTDYLEFRWYVGGKLRLNKTLGTIVKGKIKQDKDSLQEVADVYDGGNVNLSSGFLQTRTVRRNAGHILACC